MSLPLHASKGPAHRAFPTRTLLQQLPLPVWQRSCSLDLQRGRRAGKVPGPLISLRDCCHFQSADRYAHLSWTESIGFLVSDQRVHVKIKEESRERKAVADMRYLMLWCLEDHVSSLLVPVMSSQIYRCFWIGWLVGGLDLDAHTFALSKIPDLVLSVSCLNHVICLFKPVLNIHVKPLRP